MLCTKRKCGLPSLLICSLLAMSLPAMAQQAGKVPRIGWLNGGSAALSAHAEAFKGGLREHGWIEGQNVAVEWRYAETKYDKLRELANNLVKLNNVDVIVAVTNPEIRAVAQVTSTVPIVMVAGVDPIGQGFISSLRQPGGNITGLTSDVSPEIFGKYLEFLKEVVPACPMSAVLSIRVIRSARFTAKRRKMRLSNWA